MGIREAVPDRLKRALRRLLSYPPVHHARRAVRIGALALRRHNRGYPPIGLPLMPRLGEAEELLEGSEAWFEETVRQFVPEFRWFLGRIYNGAFESVDAELYYSVLRRYRPRLVIEVGTGNSAHFARDAMRRNGRGSLVVIDPSPVRKPPREAHHLAQLVQDVNPALFERLGRNDVLFIDSSHTTEEARWHVSDLLPSLTPGVIVHHHDVLWPYVRYYMDDPVLNGEPDVLLDFYLANRDRFEVLGGAAYVRYRNPVLLGRLVKSYRWVPDRVPGSVWTRVRAAASGDVPLRPPAR